MDKIGEIIGPKGKVINAMQQETGADITIDDDGRVGIVSIGSTNGAAVTEARRRIELILDPPKAEVGAVYMGRVVSTTKFGAFVNILPGRDGLLHISKIGKGQRVNNVEDVVSLGDSVEVRVDDIDAQGKVSLSWADQPVGEPGEARAERAPRSDDRGDRGPRPERSDRGPRPERGDRPERGPRPERAPRAEAPAAGGTNVVSFEDSFDAEIAAEFGDLGPAPAEGDMPSTEPRRNDRGRAPRRGAPRR
jgi:polyribonucleotide nucleotidyltransferase